MQRQEKWHAIVNSVIQGTPLELVGVECTGGGKHTLVRIYIDKPGGISIDDITSVSRQISVVVDVEEPIKGAYTLEVSSPGLDRPLFLPAHYGPQVGQKISLKTRFLQNNRQNFRGVLRAANEQSVELEVDGELITFAYEDIEKAKVIPNIEIGTRDK